MEGLVAGLGLTTPELQRCVIERIEHTDNQLWGRLKEALPAERIDNVLDREFYDYMFTIECPPNLVAENWNICLHPGEAVWCNNTNLMQNCGINFEDGIHKLDIAFAYEEIYIQHQIGHLWRLPTIIYVYIRWPRGGL